LKRKTYSKAQSIPSEVYQRDEAQMVGGKTHRTANHSRQKGHGSILYRLKQIYGPKSRE